MENPNKKFNKNTYNKEYYLKRKEEGKISRGSIKDASPEEQKRQRKRWKEAAKR